MIPEKTELPGMSAAERLRPGKITALTGVSASLAVMYACRLARAGKRVLLVESSDLRAARAADDVFQLLPGLGACLPLGETDLTRAAGSLESAWRRLEALSGIVRGNVRVLCTSAEALMLRMGRPEVFRRNIVRLRPGDRYPLSGLIAALTRMGYIRVNLVEGKGQFALRGSVMDIFPPDMPQGVRVEFFDDEVDSLRFFDCVSQRSRDRADELTVIPASEALLEPDEAAEAARRMRDAISTVKRDTGSGSLFDGLPPLPEDGPDGTEQAPGAPDARTENAPPLSGAERRIERLLEDAEAVAQGLPFRRIRTWLTVLTDRTATVTDWFRPDAVFLLEPDKLRTRVSDRLKGFAEELNSAMERSEAAGAQQSLMADWDTIIRQLKEWPLAITSELLPSTGGLKPEIVTHVGASGLPGYGGQLRRLRDDLAAWRERGMRVILLSGSAARGARLKESLNELDMPAEYAERPAEPEPGMPLILPMTLSAGFVIPDAGFALVSDADIWGAGYRKSKAHKHSGEKIDAFSDLKTGDYVVHEDYGVGLYKGTVSLSSEGVRRDYMLIIYQGNDKLYVPVEQLSRVQRYIGSSGQTPALNSLGGKKWAKEKSRVRESLKTMAFDLKALYAERTQRTGYAFSKRTPWQQEFEDEFPFELTPDQRQSVREIEKDMESDRNMDRLLCGDVGYGKTEVSLRAAFKAIMDGKQVAMLAPTTILVQQHYNTIVKRFQNTPARVEYLSRFRTSREQAQVIRKLEAGEVDIVVGTHRLLGKDVRFKNLGLLIVDEEQRFGVSHKETIKNIKKTVDVLTLSATPIPRTLHMSMVGIRDMSLLETPPEERVPVQTTVAEYSDGLIRDAILREISRGGQVFFMYNRVQTIGRFYERLRQLVPEARIGVAHGQMKERDLEDAMMDFYSGSSDVLLCTAIIENGLDVPSANTLIVYDAERFGLGQLYQLRGRVGRSSRQAYAFFTVRPDRALTETAQQRLSAIREFTEFGAGFRIAMRDLEIRGAGNVLGPEQHGHLASIGYDMYCKLMEETLAEAQGKRVARELDTRVDLKVDAYLPAEYVPDELQRMEVYRRVASVTTDEDRMDIVDELTDRFGDIPEPVMTLLDVAQLRHLCNRAGVSQALRGKTGLEMRIEPRYAPEPDRLLKAMTCADKRLGIKPGAQSAIILRSAAEDGELLKDGLKTMKKLILLLDEAAEAAVHA